MPKIQNSSSLDFECALISQMSSYREGGAEDKLKGNNRERYLKRKSALEELGWVPLETSEELIRCGALEINQSWGYFGVAYYKPPQKAHHSARLIIAHRGTQNIGNVWADVEIARREEPRILEEAAFPYVMALFDVYAFNAPIKVTYTGFSLGGFIAGACAALLPSFPKMIRSAKAVTFDAPGVGHLKPDALIHSGDIVNYMTRPNLVNTCNPQVGDVRQISAFYETHSPYLEFSIFRIGERVSGGVDMAKMILATSETHDLDRIISRLEEPRSIGFQYREVYHWPAANIQGYYGASVNPKFFGDGWVAQGSNFVFSSVGSLLWDISARLYPNEEGQGVNALSYACFTSIAYTKDEGIIQLLLALLLLTASLIKSVSPQTEPLLVAPASTYRMG